MTKTDSQKIKLIELLRAIPVVEVAVKRVGIARSTYYRWRESDPEFSQEADMAIEQSRNVVNDMAESQIISEIRAKNMTAAMFWLKHNHYMYRNKVELSGKVLKDTNTLNPEQGEIVRKALINAGLIAQGGESE